jgi:hypothetical protein
MPVAQRCRKEPNSDAMSMSATILLIASLSGMIDAISDRPSVASCGLLTSGTIGTTPSALRSGHGSPSTRRRRQRTRARSHAPVLLMLSDSYFSTHSGRYRFAIRRPESSTHRLRPAIRRRWLPGS